MNNHTESSAAMSVDIDGDAIDYQPVDSWLARVGGLPSREVSAPRPPASNYLTHTPAPDAMQPNINQLLAKLDRLNKRVNEQDSIIYYLKEEVSELDGKKTQLNQELAGLTNAKSAIKTINQRLNTIQFGFSRILDRVEVLEKTAALEDGVRSTNPTATAVAAEQYGLNGTDIGDGSVQKEGNPLAVLNSGPNRRGRKKRRALDHDDRPVPAPVGGNGSEEIAQMEALLSKVVKKLAMLKMAENDDDADVESATTGPTASPSICATANGDTMMACDGDIKAEVQL